MQVIKTPKKMQKHMLNIIKQNKQVGFVPTMGYFHEGHTSLIDQAKEDNDLVVTSIFVNPLQFGPNEDFEKYPRDAERDLDLAKQHGVDILFIPTIKDMYPDEMSISMNINKRVNVLCGRSRPGHFNGVVVVLAKLFNIILPDKVYFGMKDAQQVAVVKSLIDDYNFPIDLMGMPTIREASGLAKSSRNVYLNHAEKKEALWLYKALNVSQQLVIDGESDPGQIIKAVNQILTRKTSGIIDYVELLSYPDLKPVKSIDQLVILAVAVKFKQARLIDNILLNKDGRIVKCLN